MLHDNDNIVRPTYKSIHTRPCTCSAWTPQQGRTIKHGSIIIFTPNRFNVHGVTRVRACRVNGIPSSADDIARDGVQGASKNFGGLTRWNRDTLIVKKKKTRFGSSFYSFIFSHECRKTSVYNQCVIFRKRNVRDPLRELKYSHVHVERHSSIVLTQRDKINITCLHFLCVYPLPSPSSDLPRN